MKKGRKWLISILLILVIPTGVFLYENDYDMQEKAAVIHTEKGSLAAFLAIPNGNNEGVVIFVHGDGAQNATQDGGYKPLMERFAKQGLTSISWDKQGVGESTGNWLNQSMDDRAKEVEEVIEWAKDQKNLNTEKMILWGASQAGWVVPKVQRNREDITASILVGPAINWLRQGEYFTTREMIKAGKNDDEMLSEINKDREVSERIQSGITYNEYLKLVEDKGMSEDRFEFVQENITADAANDIKGIKSPVYLILAENDENVDSEETEKMYKQLLPEELLTVKTISKVGHSMLNPSLQNSEILTTLSAILAP